jgi:hypothetical protein
VLFSTLYVLRYLFYPAVALVKQSNCIDMVFVCSMRSLTQDVVFLVFDSCFRDGKKGNSISVHFTEYTITTIKTTFASDFLDNLAVALRLLILQYKYNIRTLSENIKFISARYDTGHKSSPNVLFSTCFQSS